jgi:hypothetical protein
MTLCEQLTTEFCKKQARPAHLVAMAEEDRLSFSPLPLGSYSVTRWRAAYR